MHLQIHYIKTNKESGLLNRCITRIHYTQSNKESCLWNRCISRIHHTTANKESCLLNRRISRTHHTTASKESCLWNRCISRTHPTTANKESYLLDRCISRTHPTTANKESCLWNRCISRKHHTGTVTGSGCRLPCAGGHKTSRPDGPSRRRRSPRKAVAVVFSSLECARSIEGEAAHSLEFCTSAEALGPPPPKSLAKGSDLGSASGGVSTSIGSSSLRSNGAEGTTPLRASSPPPVVVTDTICIPGASAAAPEFPPPPRRLADPLRHLPLHL